MRFYEAMNIDELNEEEKEDFQKSVAFFFDELVKVLSTIETDEEKIDWIKKMDALLKEPHYE